MTHLASSWSCPCIIWSIYSPYIDMIMLIIRFLFYKSYRDDNCILICNLKVNFYLNSFSCLSFQPSGRSRRKSQCYCDLQNNHWTLSQRLPGLCLWHAEDNHKFTKAGMYLHTHTHTDSFLSVYSLIYLYPWCWNTSLENLMSDHRNKVLRLWVHL